MSGADFRREPCPPVDLAALREAVRAIDQRRGVAPGGSQPTYRQMLALLDVARALVDEHSRGGIEAASVVALDAAAALVRESWATAAPTPADLAALREAVAEHRRGPCVQTQRRIVRVATWLADGTMERFTRAATPAGLQSVRALMYERGPDDDPALDATDGAHPAWWRGHEHGAEAMRRGLARRLGADEATPWQVLLKRVRDIDDAERGPDLAALRGENGR